MKFLHTSWEDVQRLCEFTADKIVKANFHPDIILGISRGGFVPARILCDLLDVEALSSVGIVYYTAVKETRERPEIIYPLNADVSGKKVLIVDDVTDTGHSLIVAKDHILNRGAKTVKIATLHYKPWSVIEPDFYAETTDAWVVYAWEIKETVKELISKFEEKSPEDIRKKLKRLGFRNL